jgi:hypothetical protein
MRGRTAATDRHGTRRGAVIAALVACAFAIVLVSAGPATARVRRVGTFAGMKGGYKSIQKAVDASEPGDWVLVGPGDYKEKGTLAPAGAEGDAGSAVLVTKPGIHIRGMDRNGVMLDGTKPGTPQCSSSPADQNLGPLDSEGHPTGRNGLTVFKADGVRFELATSRSGGTSRRKRKRVKNGSSKPDVTSPSDD